MIEFQKALNDCDSAIRLNPKYTKAYHRKAKALLGISKYWFIKKIEFKHTKLYNKH